MRPMLLMPLLLTAAAATAQDTGPRPMVSPACRQEVIAACPAAVSGDREARRACMRGKFASLSAGCRGEIMAARAARRDRRAEQPAPGESTPPPGDGS